MKKKKTSKKRKITKKRNATKTSLKKAIDELHTAGTNFVNASLLRAHAHKKSSVKKVYGHLARIQQSLNNMKSSIRR